jgi:hypothetical protein
VLTSRRGRATALGAAFVVCALLSGCGGSSPAGSGLIALLGRSGTLIQQLESQSQSVANGLSTGPVHQLNVLATSLAAGHVDAQTTSRITAFLSDPSAPFASAVAQANHVQSLASEARRAKIPQSAYRSASGTIRRFVYDWNDYVQVDVDAFAQIAVLDRSLPVMRSTLISFMQASRAALSAKDRSALRSARRAYEAALQRLARAGALPQTEDFTPAAQSAARKLASDQRAPDVQRLISVVRRRYPLSFFAAHSG